MKKILFILVLLPLFGLSQTAAPDTIAHLKTKSQWIKSNYSTHSFGIHGKFRYVDGNQSNGYVLTSDADGNATWQAGGGGSDGNGIYSGSGSLAGSHTVTFGSNDLTFAATSTGKFKLNVGSDATGDMYFRNSSGNIARLGVGSADRILTSNGTNPQWSDPVTVSATPLILPIGPDPDDFTAGQSFGYTLPSLAGAGGNKTITLPSASTCAGKQIIFINTNTDSNVWQFAAAVSYPNGTTSTAFANQSSKTLWSNGSVWYVIAEK